MELLVNWIATHPFLVFLAVPGMAGMAAWGLGRRLERRGTPCQPRTWWLLSATAGAIFAAFAITTARHVAMIDIDNLLASGLSLSMPPALLWMLSWFTHLGDREFLTLIAVGMTGGLLWRRQWRLALACAVITGGAGALNQLFKHLFKRVRPEHAHGYIHADGWSFPSGHATASLAVYGFACYLAMRALPAAWRTPCLAGVAALVAAIGVSRVLLQVHFLSDVAAGFAFSLAWFALCMAVAGSMGTIRSRR